MVLLYLSAAWAGGILTAVALWGALGPALALAVAPVGASLLTAGIACLACLRPDLRPGRGAARGWQQAR